MVGVQAGMGLSARLRGAIISATPMLVLGLTMFVVALNMRHYSTTCDTQSARDAALSRAAMERRIKALEKEIFQNGVLLEKVLQGLDAAFQASAVLSVKELRLMAQVEASEIEHRRARQPPPPMSEFAKSRVSKAVDGGKLQDLVEAAIGSDTSSYFGGGAGEDGDAFLDGLPREANGGNAGWDWGPTESFVTDDFLNNNEVDLIEPVKLDISDEERDISCRKWLKDHGVTPRVDWGTLPAEQQQLWKQYRCDEVALGPPAGGPEPPVEGGQSRMLAPGGDGDGNGAGQAAAAGGLDRGGPGRAWRGEQGRGGSDAAADSADGELDEDLSSNAEAAAAAAAAAGAAAGAGAGVVR